MGLVKSDLGQVNLGTNVVLVARVGLDQDWKRSGPSGPGHESSSCCKAGSGSGMDT